MNRQIEKTHKKNNIKILTFHDTLNYGATLQCYALQKFVSDLGFYVEILNYKNNKFKKIYSPFYIADGSIKKILNAVLCFPSNIKKIHRKNKFDSKYLKLTYPFTTDNLSTSCINCEAIIVGSDQVWNSNFNKTDYTYLLDFVPNNIKKISYAASFGVNYIDEEFVASYRKFLNRFDYISVREEMGQEIIKKLGIDLPTSIVLDPVFLIDFSAWLNIAKKPKKVNYILLYVLRNSKTADFAFKYAKETNKNIVFLDAPMKESRKCAKVRGLGIEDWIGWFVYADCIITDSFHGTAFSLIFNKKFISFKTENDLGADSRISSLLSECELTDRLTEHGDCEILNREIDYRIVNERIKLMVEDSKKYLMKALNVRK